MMAWDQGTPSEDEMRRRIADALIRLRKAKVEALQADPTLDYNVAEHLKASTDRKIVMRDLMNIKGDQLVNLWKHHCGGGPGFGSVKPHYVW